VLVLTWNLFHGRAQPPAGRALMGEFARTLAGWEWDVALLQEVQPWWPPVLARVAAARQVSVLTSRHSLLPLRRAIAVRDYLISQGVAASTIDVAGLGSARPAADNSTADGRARNRRVEIVVSGGPLAGGGAVAAR